MRHGNVYYYDKWRDGDRVRSEYVGCGAMALLAHQQAEEKVAKRRAFESSRDEITKLHAEVNQAVDLLLQLAEAEMVAAGFHRHKRQWRKRRNG